jgi:hypothetical protein
MDEAFNRFLRFRDELAQIAAAEPDGSDQTDAWPNAFNLWLARTRREAVVTEMGVASGSSSGVTLHHPDWESYTDMSTDLAVDDAVSIRRGSRGGLMSRSVRVTIEKAGTCQKGLLTNSARMETARLD